MTSSHPVRGAAASVASAAFETVARARRRKPLHPRGLVVPAHLVRHGLEEPVGAAWLDEPGSGEGVARISRSAGFPDGWPDVWGLAVRFDSPQAASGVADLMLATSFHGRAGRHVLALRGGLRAPLTCVLPYRTQPGRTVMIGVPERSGSCPGSGRPSPPTSRGIASSSRSPPRWPGARGARSAPSISAVQCWERATGATTSRTTS